VTTPKPRSSGKKRSVAGKAKIVRKRNSDGKASRPGSTIPGKSMRGRAWAGAHRTSAFGNGGALFLGGGADKSFDLERR